MNFINLNMKQIQPAGLKRYKAGYAYEMQQQYNIRSLKNCL
jgi:hypothetical protein